MTGSPIEEQVQPSLPSPERGKKLLPTLIIYVSPYSLRLAGMSRRVSIGIGSVIISLLNTRMGSELIL